MYVMGGVVWEGFQILQYLNNMIVKEVKMLKIREDVKEALELNKPIVALESTIIAHGMPYPENVRVALEVENCVKVEGCVPATIGVIKGNIIVGMTEKEIEFIGKKEGILKLSTREIPLCITQKKTGATTVSATSFIAHKAGIKVFATGGIGGVHRDFEKSMDISRDLEELSRTDIVVVSSGAKSILDLAKTIEYLETKGVLILGFKTNEFPAFYTRHSGIRIPEIQSGDAIAEIYKEKEQLSLKSAILVANPIPKEYEIEREEADRWISQALMECHKKGIYGKEVTPFLLSRIVELSGGKSLEANIHLVKSNAKVASKIAIALSK